jgi:hypothetical protein
VLGKDLLDIKPKQKMANGNIDKLHFKIFETFVPQRFPLRWCPSRK